MIKKSRISSSRSRQEPAAEIALELSASHSGTVLNHRKLYPNVVLLGLIYQAMGFPAEMFRAVCHPRTARWIARWEEMLLDPDQKIAGLIVYTGPAHRDYDASRQAPVVACSAGL